jgi:hypothetical protein
MKKRECFMNGDFSVCNVPVRASIRLRVRRALETDDPSAAADVGEVDVALAPWRRANQKACMIDEQ